MRAHDLLDVGFGVCGAHGRSALYDFIAAGVVFMPRIFLACVLV